MNSKPQGDPRQYDNWLILFAGGFFCFLGYKFFLKMKIWVAIHPILAATIGSILIFIVVLASVGLIVAWMEPRKRAATIKKLFKKI